jgi:two-component system sensor histidine kinase YesM
MKIEKYILVSLRAKLLIMFILLTAIPIIIVGTIAYSKSYSEISESSLNSSFLLTNQVKQNLDHLIQETRVFMQMGTLESTVNFLIQDQETYEEAIDILNAFEIYKKTYAYSSSIENIYILSFNGKAISERKGVYDWRDEMSLQLRMEQVKGLSEDIMILPSLVNSEENSLSIVGKIHRTITHELIGLMIIDLDSSLIESAISDHKLGTNGSFFIIDKAGHPIFAPKHQADNIRALMEQSTFTEQENGHFTLQHDNKEWFVVFNTLKDTDWNIVGIADKNDIMQDANEIRTLILISVASSILFTITLYFFITASLTRPIRDLQAKMNLVAAGRLDVKVTNSSRDEIANLGLSFNMMIKKIQMLMEKSIEEQIQIKKAELRTLQVQINPHFLYNSLDTIIWMAEGQKSDKVIDITKALSHFFRITLSEGRDRITLEDEIAHIQNYLIIQQMRYRDILDVEFHINPAVRPYHILKLTLQPLIENAIYHGIKNKRGRGLISIHADFNGQDTIFISIVDNGIGMTKERLDQIRGLINHPREQELTKQGSYGMSNVHQRIRLYYGQPYGISIESEPQKGTICSILIPAEKGEFR